MSTPVGTPEQQDANTLGVMKPCTPEDSQETISEEAAVQLSQRLVKFTQTRRFRDAWDILTSLSPADARKVVNTGLPSSWYNDGPSK